MPVFNRYCDDNIVSQKLYPVLFLAYLANTWNIL